jgi:hypothetical protein
MQLIIIYKALQIIEVVSLLLSREYCDSVGILIRNSIWSAALLRKVSSLIVHTEFIRSEKTIRLYRCVSGNGYPSEILNAYFYGPEHFF